MHADADAAERAILGVPGRAARAVELHRRLFVANDGHHSLEEPVVFLEPAYLVNHPPAHQPEITRVRGNVHVGQFGDEAVSHLGDNGS